MKDLLSSQISSARNGVVSQIGSEEYRCRWAGSDALILEERMQIQCEERPISEEDFVLWLSMDQAKGTAIEDKSRFGNHCEIVGATWVAGEEESALRFAGGDNHLNCGNDGSLDVTGAITIEAWVKLNTYESSGGYGDLATILNKPTAYSVEVDSQSGKLGVSLARVTDGRVFSNTALPLDEWVHIAITYDRSELTWYVNGKLDRTMSVTGTTNRSPYNLIVGGDPRVGRFLNGTMGSVRILNRTLSAEQISAIYNSQEWMASQQ